MGEKKTSTKKLCNKALEKAEKSLIELPKVVGLGVVKNREEGEHRVAVYVSSMPASEKERQVFPESLPVPDSDVEVKTEIIEIGEVALETPLSGLEPDENSQGLGKEPL